MRARPARPRAAGTPWARAGRTAAAPTNAITPKATHCRPADDMLPVSTGTVGPVKHGTAGSRAPHAVVRSARRTRRRRSRRLWALWQAAPHHRVLDQHRHNHSGRSVASSSLARRRISADMLPYRARYASQLAANQAAASACFASDTRRYASMAAPDRTGAEIVRAAGGGDTHVSCRADCASQRPPRHSATGPFPSGADRSQSLAPGRPPIAKVFRASGR